MLHLLVLAFPSFFLQRSCHKSLGKLQEINRTLGSVEKSVFNWMEAINSTGEYIISSEDGQILQSINDAITVKVQLLEDDDVRSRIFHLDDLTELSSKLYLMGGARHHRPQVAKFLQVCIVSNRKLLNNTPNLFLATVTVTGSQDICRNF